MKILWLHSHFVNWMGGHQYIYEVTKRLARKHHVTVAASIFSASALQKFRLARITTQTVGTTSTYSAWYWLLLPFFLDKEAKTISCSGKFDIVITSYFPAHLWANKLNLPFVQICYEPLAFFHDQQFLTGYSTAVRFFFRFMKILYHNWDRQALLNARQVLTLSKYNAKWISHVYKRKDVEVIYEGVDTDFFKPVVHNNLENKYRENKIIFHSTDFTPTKGTDLLLKAMPQLLKKHLQAKLLISSTVTHNKNLNELARYIQENKLDRFVQFLGRVPFADLPKYYSLADVVVQPSRQQSMSLSVKEAMACQTPVITSPEGKEQFTDGTAGYLVDPVNSQELSDKILYILNHKDEAREMGQRGRQIILKKFSWEKVAEKLLLISYYLFIY